MSLVQECLESFGLFGGSISAPTAYADDYDINTGLYLIGMESASALSEIYELDYEVECESAIAVADAKRLGIPVEESMGEKLDNIGAKIKEKWGKVKEWLKKLWGKIVAWFKKVGTNIKDFLKRVKTVFSKSKITDNDIDVKVTNEKTGEMEVTIKNLQRKYEGASKNLERVNRELNSTKSDLAASQKTASDLANRTAELSKQVEDKDAELAGTRARYRDAMARRDAASREREANAVSAAQNKGRADADKAYYNARNGAAAAVTRRLTFKMYVYDTGAMNTAADNVVAAYNRLSKDTEIGKLAAMIDEMASAAIDRTSVQGDSKFKYSDEHLDAKGVIDDIVRVFNIEARGQDSSAMADAMYSRFRSGAKRGDEKPGIKQANAKITYMNGIIDACDKISAKLGNIEASLNKFFGDAVKSCDRWEQAFKVEHGQAKAKGAPASWYSRMSSTMSRWSASISNAQSLISGIIRELTSATREAIGDAGRFKTTVDPELDPAALNG